jgi:hypothetical protein
VQPITIERSPRLWLPLLGVVVLTAVAGFVAREIYRPQAGSQSGQTVVTSSSTAPPAEQPGPREVMATQDAATHPQSGQIRQMLQDHFDSINARDYAKWRGTVTRARLEKMPETTWRQDYRSTKDGSVLIYRIEAAPDRKLRVLIGFTSVQNVADAPAELPKECIQWHVVLPVAKEDNRWRIDAGQEGSSPQYAECGAAAF